jgi:hypothetical protein
LAEGEVACAILCCTSCDYATCQTDWCESPGTVRDVGLCCVVNEVFALPGRSEAWIGCCRRFGIACRVPSLGSSRWDRQAILVDLITRSIYGDEYKSSSLSVCTFLHSPVAFCLIGRSIALSALFSNTISPCSSRNMRDRVSHPYEAAGEIKCLCDENRPTGRSRSSKLF